MYNFSFQLYILFVLGGDGGVLPAAFGLMTGKTKNMYRDFWALIKQQCGPDVTPRTLCMDLEQASFLAFGEIFEVNGRTVDVQLCFFHFERALM